MANMKATELFQMRRESVTAGFLSIRHEVCGVIADILRPLISERQSVMRAFKSRVYTYFGIYYTAWMSRGKHSTKVQI